MGPCVRRDDGYRDKTYAASMRRKPFHTAVAVPEVSTGEHARVLVIAVEGDALQRRQMIGAFGKDHAGRVVTAVLNPAALASMNSRWPAAMRSP